jgi:ubiquitin C-terminal hydrolase
MVLDSVASLVPDCRWPVPLREIRRIQRLEHVFTYKSTQWQVVLMNQNAYLGLYIVPVSLLLGFDLQISVNLAISSANPDATTAGMSRDLVFTFEADDEGKCEDQGYAAILQLATAEHMLDAEGRFFVDVRFAAHDLEPRTKKQAIAGFVGLRNQGATCYINSLLQTLFLIPTFRKTVFALPNESGGEGPGEKDPSRIGLALQTVFYNMQTKEAPVETEVLTRSFGWDSADAFEQHDVQEFSRVLLDSLEETMKGTSMTNTVTSLFQGQTQMYINCKNVDYSSTRTEKFYDLALNVKGVGSLLESLQEYVREETLQGANQYRAEGHGLQDAIKGCRFETFPPVLQLQLKRFEFDVHTMQNIKINDYFAFPAELDLSEFINSEEPHMYHLYGVLVHSGGLHGGHYYSYIRPVPPTGEISDAPWVKFDDEMVHRVGQEEALKRCFGGPSQEGGTARVASAYMLVYLREDQLRSCQANAIQRVGASAEAMLSKTHALHIEVPESLERRIAAMQQDVVRQKEQKEEDAKYQTVAMVSEGNLVRAAVGLELTAQTIDGSPPPTLRTGHGGAASVLLDAVNDTTEYVENNWTVRVRKDACLREWSQVEQEVDLCIPQEHREFVHMVKRTNTTCRPRRKNARADLDMRFQDSVREDNDGKAKSLYVRDTRHDDLLSPVPAGETETLLVIKFFDIERQTLTLLGSGWFSALSPLNLVAKYAGDLMADLGLVSDKRRETLTLKILEEECASGNDLKYHENLESTLSEAKLVTGDILIVNRVYSAEDLHLIKRKHDEAYQSWLQDDQGCAPFHVCKRCPSWFIVHSHYTILSQGMAGISNFSDAHGSASRPINSPHGPAPSKVLQQQRRLPQVSREPPQSRDALHVSAKLPSLYCCVSIPDILLPIQVQPA